MKVHFRQINRGFRYMAGAQFHVPCGTDANWITSTTSAPEKVTCKRCLDYLKSIGAEGITSQDIAETEPPTKP